MRVLSPVFFLLSFGAFAGENVLEEQHGPLEFSEEEIQKEIEANRQASSGKARINSIDIQWSPNSIVLHGNTKRIAEEAAIIRESLKAFPFLAPFEKHVVVSADAKSLDLTELLKKIEKALPDNCYSCFSLPLCSMKKNFRNMDSADLMAVIGDSHSKKKAKDLGPGSVVVYRENYNMKDPYHAYLWLSPILALEKRGTGYLLIRPQSEIEKEYKDLAGQERKSFKVISGNKMPSFSSPITKEYWVRK